MERSMTITFTIDHGVARSADGSLLWTMDDLDSDSDSDLTAGALRGARRGGGGEEAGAAVLVPASDAAVAGLEKQVFHATPEGCDVVAAGCAICLENFQDDEEVTVMPCSRRHEFHPDCITKWLAKSNTCPLCRHALPTDDAMDDDGL